MTIPEPDFLTVAITPSQGKVLTQLMRDGADNKTIARRLSVSEDTVKTHLKRLMAATGAASRTEMVVAIFRRQVVLQVDRVGSKPSARPPIKHGTAGGYRAHMSRETEPCEPCVVAMQEHSRVYLTQARAARWPTKEAS